MSYVPPMELLRGLSIDNAECFGKPNINAWYLQNNANVNMYNFNHNASCHICGRMATNVHHCPPKSKGKFILHGHILRPSLFALCGSGTTGCHGKIHQRLIVPKWVWYSDSFAKSWWDGELLDTYEPHSEMLYEFGCWEFEEKS